MSSEFWMDPTTLDPARRALRLKVHEAMLRHVTAAVTNGSIKMLFDAIVSDRDPNEDLNILASGLTGKWTVISESWQGPSRDHFFLKSTYRDADSICLLSADGCDEVEVDYIWLDNEEFKTIKEVE